MSKKGLSSKEVEPGSGVKHDKHAPKAPADIAAIEAHENAERVSMDNSKAEIIAECEENESDIESCETKAELLEAIDESE